MFHRPKKADTWSMELWLWLEDDDPVSGRLGADAQSAVAFVGWLGLFGVLEGLLAGGRAQATSHGQSGQLGARGDP